MLRPYNEFAWVGNAFAQTVGESLFGGCYLRGGIGVFLGEAFDATGGVDELLLSGEERVAIGADFDVKLFALDGRACGEVVAAGAVHGYGVIIGVDTGLHGKLHSVASGLHGPPEESPNGWPYCRRLQPRR